MMIGCRGAAGQQQFGERNFTGQRQFFGCQPRPHRVERLQPGKQRLVDHRGPGTGEGLIEMVMGVDQPRQQHMLARIKDVIARAGGVLPDTEQFNDALAFEHQAASGIKGVGGEHGQGIF